MTFNNFQPFKWGFLLILTFLFCVSRVKAQNVIVSPNTGNFLTATVDAQDSDANNDIGSLIDDFHSTWRHKQLPLIMIATHTLSVANNVGGGGSQPAITVGYRLTNEGLPARSNNNFLPKDNSMVYIAPGGKSFFVVRLPKGFRFTSYRIVFERYGQTITSNNNSRYYFAPRDEDYTFRELKLNNDLELLITDNSVMAPKGETKDFVLTRTSKSPGDMGASLYFGLTSVTQQYPAEYAGSPDIKNEYKQGAAIKIKYIELTYTPENDFTVDLAPFNSMISPEGKPHHTLPFTTGIMDFGEVCHIPVQLDPSRRPASYYYNWTEDMKAYLDLYDYEAVTEDGNIDDASEHKTIKVENINGRNYFRLEPGRTYVLEAPTYAKAISKGKQINDGVVSEAEYNLKFPMYYRLKKVKFYGTAAANVGFTIQGFLSSYGRPTEQKAYLGILDGKPQYIAMTSGTPATWYIDNEQRLYTVSNGTKQYIQATFDTFYKLSFTTDAAQATKGFEIRHRIMYYNVNNRGTITSYILANESSTGQARMTTFSSAQPATILYGSDNSVHRTLQVYSRDGKTSEEFNMTDNVNVYTLDNLNNDAVKFSVPAGGQPVYVYFYADMEALNPYVDHLTIQAQAEGDFVGNKVYRTFLINDFNSIGNVFIFHAPINWQSKHVSFTFTQLSTRYADNTYGPLSGTGSSRYSFVKSKYFNDVNADFYANRDKVMDSPYEDKITTLLVGKSGFKFNNADEVATLPEGSSFYFNNNTFSLEKYRAQTGVATADDNFKTLVMTPGTFDNPTSETIHLITTDETRYNLSPTWATEHRAYAFYETKIQLAAVQYERHLEYKKLFDSYSKRKNAVVPFYGVTVTTTPAEGVLDMDGILYEAVNNERTGGFPTDQILYVDLSPLSGVVLIDKEWIPRMAKAKAGQQERGSGLNPNLLMYVPEGMGLQLDNMATRQAFSTEKTFLAANNVVLADGEPFAAPYPIQLDYERFATYTRERSRNNRVVSNATLMLPFELTLTEGNKHVNEKSPYVLKFHQMASSNAVFTKQDDNSHEMTVGAFLPISATRTAVHTPYMVTAEGATSETVSFAVDQRGATILPNVEVGDLGTNPTVHAQYRLGETSSVTVGNEPITLTHVGSYIGKENQNIYYFGNDRFWNSATYRTGSVMTLPFRAYYEYPATAEAATRSLRSFGIYFGEPEFNGIVTSIDTPQNTGLWVSSSGGVMTFSTDNDCRVDVFNLAGQRMKVFRLNAGAYKQVPLPLGIYIVNGKKYINK